MPTFFLPDPGEGLTEAEIVRWHVAPGQTIEVNQVVVEVETHKSVVELPSPFSGVVTHLAAEEGATLAVGSPLLTVDAADAPDQPASPAVLVGYGTTARPGAAPGLEPVLAGAGVMPAGQVAGRDALAATQAVGCATASQARQSWPVLTKPPVRALAKQLGVDLAAVLPTGRGGLVTRQDVLDHARSLDPPNAAWPEPAAAVASAPPVLDQGAASEVRGRWPLDTAAPLRSGPAAPPAWLTGGAIDPDGRTSRVPVRSLRRQTAQAMVSSAFSAPHVTVFQTVDVTKSIKLVKRLREQWPGQRVTPLLLVAKSLILAVLRHPEVNASWDQAAGQIVYKHYLNLGIAVQTERGLLVPNVKDAHRLSLDQLAAALSDLTVTARAGRTPPAALTDGTVTLTNVGSFGVDTGTPILSPGEAVILAFGAIARRPWVKGGQIKPRWVTQLALSFDHRLVDGALGAQLLSDVARVLEEPAQAMIWS